MPVNCEREDVCLLFTVVITPFSTGEVLPALWRTQDPFFFLGGNRQPIKMKLINNPAGVVEQYRTGGPVLTGESSFWIGESSETLGKAMETMNSSLQMQTDDWLMGGVRNKLVPWLHREWRRAWGAHDVMHKAATESFLLVWLHLHLQHPFTRYDEVLQMLHSPFSKTSCPLPLSQELGMVYPPTLPIFLPANHLFLSFQQRLGEATCERQSFRAQYRTT